jgi:hypothetical protein
MIASPDPVRLPGPYRPPGDAPPSWAAPTTCGLAIASLVLGIVWLGGIGALLAVVFGFLALRQIGRSQGRLSGKGLAIAGLVLGGVGIVGAVGFAFLIADVTHGIEKAFTPTQLRLGQSATYSPDDGGLTSITVESLQVPYQGASSLDQPGADEMFAVAAVSECAGPDGLPDGTNSLGWQLVFPDGATASPAFDAEHPGLDSPVPVLGGQCSLRYLTFQIDVGSSPSWLEYDGTVIHPFEWRVGGG